MTKYYIELIGLVDKHGNGVGIGDIIEVRLPETETRSSEFGDGYVVCAKVLRGELSIRLSSGIGLHITEVIEDQEGVWKPGKWFKLKVQKHDWYLVEDTRE